MTAQDSRARQTECDLLVVGSGAGGLSAATTAAWHGLRVVVVEKDRVCGGATAWSGGWASVPLNPLAQADGIVEDLDRPRTYLKHVLGEHYDAARVDALLDAKRLLIDDGAVQGAVVDTPDGEVTIRARCGTVLAAGGFPGDVNRRRELFPRTPTGQEHWTLAPASCSGDGIGLGQSAGGQMETRLASPVAWCPVSLVPYRSGRVGRYPHIVDRGKPGLIAVLADGRRFVNEADGYYDFVSAMVRAVPEGQEVAAWLICDHAFQRRYPFGMSKPFPVPVWPYLRSGYLKRGRTLDELARTCGIDPTGLKRTIGQFNRHARNGEDPEFGRGSTPFNRGSGDPDHTPNPSLAPITRPPFYAIKVLPGSFGTFAGLRTDARARVLNAAGDPVTGLYAVGCDQASVMGGHYPSGGINIGPALTFGYIAGRHCAGATEYENRVPVPQNDGV